MSTDPAFKGSSVPSTVKTGASLEPGLGIEGLMLLVCCFGNAGGFKGCKFNGKLGLVVPSGGVTREVDLCL